ncbi:MAG: hypothetical protein ACJ8AE_00035, partial [Gemmatimonadaceae bacterium]
RAKTRYGVENRRGGSSLAPTPFERRNRRVRPRRFFDGARLDVCRLIQRRLHVGGESNGGVRALKAARNHALWREVNERIRLVAEDSGDAVFLCECASLECTQTVHLNIPAYERIRSSPTRFLIALGHEFPEVGELVEASDGYTIVEKKGAAARQAVKMDPRSRSAPGA